jgi:CBS domain-containing protein
MTRTLVQEVMTTPVVTATEGMPFRDLAALLYARDIGGVPVVAPAGELLGVVSRPDLIPKAAGLAAAAGQLLRPPAPATSDRDTEETFRDTSAYWGRVRSRSARLRLEGLVGQGAA